MIGLVIFAVQLKILKRPISYEVLSWEVKNIMVVLIGEPLLLC